MVSTAVTEVPAPFARALGTLRDAARTLRIQVQEVPAPRAARYSVALEGTLADPGDDAHELAATMRETLPRFMVPSRLVRVDSMPLTKNGKADKKALLALASSARHGSKDGDRHDR